MQKHQTLAVLALGAALGFVAAQERLPWQSRVAANTARVEFDRETVQAVKEATAPCAHAQSQCAQGQLSCCADASRGEQLLALADASAAVAAHNLAVAATAQASGKKPNIVVI